MDALEQLNLAAPIVDIYLDVESAIINHIARQLTANPDTMINATSEWRILMLARMGRLNKDTARIISGKVKKVPDKVQNVVNNAIDNILTEYGLEMTDKLSGNIFKVLENYDRQAVKDKYNQVNTVMQYKAKQIYRNSVNAIADRFDRMMQEKLENSQEYLDVLNKQALAVTLGETSRTQALRETITEMSEKGIPAFVDASGREWSPEAYVNMDIRNTAKNAALAAEFASLDELGQDIILVSAHAGARPRCYPFQGKFYSRSGKSGTIKDARGREYKFEPFDKTSFGEAAGLFGINCGHRMRGVSDGTFINREEHYSEKENSEEYEKVCKQRQMERRIRADKRTQEALEAAGDTEGAKAVKKRIAAENKALHAYCDKEGLTYRQDRTQIYGYSDTSRKKKPVNFAETVDKSGESGIISYRKFIDGDKINQFFYYDDYANNSGLLARKNSDYGKWLSALSNDEKDAVCWYAADGYGDINDYLRRKNGWESISADIVNDAVGNIDNTISRFVLKDNITVQRGAMEDSLDDIIEAYDINDLSELVGKTYVDKAFMSTTVMMDNRVATVKPVVFDIEIPKGKGRGAYINKIAGEFEDTEYEFLIKRGAKFTITNVTEDADIRKVYVKMVMNDD